jgi:hypothetical protein
MPFEPSIVINLSVAILAPAERKLFSTIFESSSIVPLIVLRVTTAILALFD